MAKRNRSSQAALVAARSAHQSGIVRCYVEAFERTGGRADLRLREKSTRRTIRVLSGDPAMHQIAPMANLMTDCHAHGHGLIKPTGRAEYVAIAAQIESQNPLEICFWLDQLAVTVHIETDAVTTPPVSVWCYIEEYSTGEGGMSLRLRQKETGRKVEMYGDTAHHLAAFLTSPQLTGARMHMTNLYEKDGLQDYVLVSGGTAIDSFDVIRYNNGDDLTYLLGPTPDTAYRDAFRRATEETAAESHARTARKHPRDGHYREAVLFARLAVETASGGGGVATRDRVANASQPVRNAADALYKKRHIAVHESETRIEQQDAELAVSSMDEVLAYLLRGA